MKELWKANPFHLMNSPFAEMGYNSCVPNIVPERLLLATRRPSTHHPLASGAASFDPLRATCRWAINHLNTRHNIWRLPASHLPSFCVAPGGPLHSIRHLAASHPLAPAQHPSALCKPSARQFTARCPATPCKPSVIARHSIRRPPRVIRQHPAGNLLARTDALNGPQNKPSAQAGALNPCKNTFCVIVNCPLQIKPVFYFLFTSIASPAHRIRVKSSLLRLGRSCLALPFTHLGKDIT